MDHVAIMKKSWDLIPKILTGQKTIESRWYQTKRSPWGKIKSGDRVFFKNSGEPITVRATVGDIEQFEIKNIAEVESIIKNHGHGIQLVNRAPKSWPRLPKYCILIFLKDTRSVKPFSIDKTGFGTPAAWLTVENIDRIKINA